MKIVKLEEPKNRISEETVKHVAKLANLPLTKKEIKKFTGQLIEIIDYNIKLLEKVDTSALKPTAHTGEITNVTRKDEPTPSLTSEQVLDNAKNTYNNFFKTKAVFEEL